MTGEVPPTKPDVVECYGCDKHVAVVAEHKTHGYKKRVTSSFRCFVCGRIYCRDCAPEHFGIDDGADRPPIAPIREWVDERKDAFRPVPDDFDTDAYFDAVAESIADAIESHANGDTG